MPKISRSAQFRNTTEDYNKYVAPYSNADRKRVRRITVNLPPCCCGKRVVVALALLAGDAPLVSDLRQLSRALVSPAEQVGKQIEGVTTKTGHEKSRAQREVMGHAVPRMKTRKQITAELQNSTGERAAALRWVLSFESDRDTVDRGMPKRD